MFACVDKGGGHTELTHVFEHDAVVRLSSWQCLVNVREVLTVELYPEDAVCVRGAYGGNGGRDGVDGDELSLETGCEEGNVGKGEGVASSPKGSGDAAFADVDGHTCVGAEEGEFPELDGHVWGRARG